MSYVFGVPTKKHVEYQIKTHLPWQYKNLKNHLPCLPKEHLEPLSSLYTWHRSREEEGGEAGAQSGEEDEEGEEIATRDTNDDGAYEHAMPNVAVLNHHPGKDQAVVSESRKEPDERPYNEPGIHLSRLN
jgi:hypothetical protein